MPSTTDTRLANMLGALVLALADDLRDTTETAAGQGATAPSALVALHEFLGHATMDQLRRAIGLTPSGAVRLVDRLERAGYVQRRPGSDGRSVALVLTATGTRAARRVQAARRRGLDNLLRVLSPAERASLDAITAKLLGAVTTQRLASRAQGLDPPGGWLCRMCDFDACGRDDGMCPTAEAAKAASG